MTWLTRELAAHYWGLMSETQQRALAAAAGNRGEVPADIAQNTLKSLRSRGWVGGRELTPDGIELLRLVRRTAVAW